MEKAKPHQFRPPLADAAAGAGGAPRVAATRGSMQQGDSWEAYRKWLSRVDTGPVRRQQADLSLYSWKGYQNWAAKIRRDWGGEKQADCVSENQPLAPPIKR